MIISDKTQRGFGCPPESSHLQESEMLERIEKLKKIMQKNHFDAVFVNSYENRRYLSGFTGSNGYVLITSNDHSLITDQRYEVQANDQTVGFEIYIHGIDPYEMMKDIFSRKTIKTIGYEANSLTVQFFHNLQNSLPHMEWVPLSSEFYSMRRLKDEKELKLIKQAIEIADQSFHQLLPRIQPGMTEKEVAVELEYLIGKNGQDGPAFGTIVASDIRAALPHATPSSNVVKNDDFLLIDFGVKYKGYMSDMTRTIWIGSPNQELQQYDRIVHVALEEAIAAIKPGRTGHEIDAVARRVFQNEGLESYSLRGLGHGVGLAIHEHPRIVLNGKEVIEAGMVFTVEPGLYVPNKVGVRVEDIIHVTDGGCEILTKTPRHIHI